MSKESRKRIDAQRKAQRENNPPGKLDKFFGEVFFGTVFFARPLIKALASAALPKKVAENETFLNTTSGVVTLATVTAAMYSKINPAWISQIVDSLSAAINYSQ